MCAPVINKNVLRAALLLATCMAQAVYANEKLFGAPSGSDVSAAPAVGTTGNVTLALLIVLVCVFALAWMLKKMRRLQGGKHGEITIVSQVAFGTKERAVLIKVRDVHLLVGVSAGQVNTLHTFADFPVSENTVATAPSDAGQSTLATVERPSFQAILKRSLGLSQ